MLHEHAGSGGCMSANGAVVGDQVGHEQPDRCRSPYVRPPGEQAKGLGQNAAARRSEAGPRPQMSRKRLGSHMRLLLSFGRFDRALRLMSV